jgi:hypothetical protein
MPRNDLNLPSQVSESIREYITRVVAQAESGYTSAQEKEDAVTGALGEALRTKEDQLVNVTDSQLPGVWRWSIGYSNLGSGAADSTESIVGADGVLEIRVGNAEIDQQKCAVFQAKNGRRKDARLLSQCIKMSTWREASFVLCYSSAGYFAYELDEVLYTNGTLAKSKVGDGVSLASWIVDWFVACRNGHRELYYDKTRRRLYWEKERTFESQSWEDRRVWVDFSPRHWLNIHVSPPDWRWARATQITADSVSKNRLVVTPLEMFGLEVHFTHAALKKRFAKLVHTYHPDKHDVSDELKSILTDRFSEITETNRTLKQHVTFQAETPRQARRREKKSNEGLQAPSFSTVEAFMDKRKRRVKMKAKKTT